MKAKRHHLALSRIQKKAFKGLLKEESIVFKTSLKKVFGSFSVKFYDRQSSPDERTFKISDKFEKNFKNT